MVQKIGRAVAATFAALSAVAVRLLVETPLNGVKFVLNGGISLLNAVTNTREKARSELLKKAVEELPSITVNQPLETTEPLPFETSSPEKVATKSQEKTSQQTQTNTTHTKRVETETFKNKSQEKETPDIITVDPTDLSLSGQALGAWLLGKF